jgi:hypothetical protein
MKIFKNPIQVIFKSQKKRKKAKRGITNVVFGISNKERKLQKEKEN